MTAGGKRKKTFVVPDEPSEPRERVRVFSFGGGDHDGRDTSKPIASRARVATG